MASFQGVNNNNQLQQQLVIAARQQNTASAPANGGADIKQSGNTLPPVAGNSTTSESLSGQQVQEAVAKLSDFVQTVQRNLSFSIDDSTGETIITVIDSETDEVVRQIPSEYLVKVAQNLKELQQALDNPDGSKGNLFEIRV